MELSIFDLVQDHVEVQIGDNLLPDYHLKNRPYRIVTEKIDISSVNAERLKAEGYDMSDEAKEERKKRKLKSSECKEISEINTWESAICVRKLYIRGFKYATQDKACDSRNKSKWKRITSKQA